MKARVALTVWIFLASLIALAAGAAMLSAALEIYAPLNGAHLGPNVPAFTEAILAGVGSYPIYMLISAIVTSLLAIYFWRSPRQIERRTFSVAVLSALNLFFACYFPMSFFVAYFVLPKAANAA
jgi:hypothetical protein